MSSIVLTEARRTYAAQRGVSQGASITLVGASGGYLAQFDCARRCAAILGNHNLTDVAIPPESMPRLLIPTEDLHRSINKLSETMSVALVDTTTDANGTRFVLVWKISPTAKDSQGANEEVNLDDY